MDAKASSIVCMSPCDEDEIKEFNSQKRKSFEIAPEPFPVVTKYDSVFDEESENSKPTTNLRSSNDSDSSQSKKKTRVTKNDIKESLPLTTAPKTRASGLPKPALVPPSRRSSQIKSYVKSTGTLQQNPVVAAQTSTAHLATTTTTNTVTFAKPAVIEVPSETSSSTPFHATPSKGVLGSAAKMDIDNLPSTSAPFTRSLRKQQVEYLSKRDKINYFFQTGLSIKEERVAALLSAAPKQKSTIFSKDKTKRNEAAIKELKDTISTFMSDIAVVRDNCISHENVLNEIISDVREKLKDTTSTITNLQANESRYKREVLKLTYEKDSIKSASDKLEIECEKLRQEVKEINTNLVKVEEKLKGEESARLKAETIVEQIEREMNNSKSAASQSISEVREEYNQRIEQSISGYKHEILSLRSELEKRQADIDRYVLEKAELEKKCLDTMQEMFRVQSLLREAENAKERLEREVQRLSSDLNGLRDQSMVKDSDLRTTLMSLTDLQRQSAEEKAGLRAEISTMLIRVKALEEERLSIMSELSLKRDDYSSTIRDLQQSKETIATLEAKLQSKESESMQYKEIVMQLEIEKELRSRCEVREEAERRERIAACAQLIAIQNESNSRIRDIEERMSQQIEQTTQQLQLVISERDTAMDTTKQYSDKILGLDSEIIQLKHALDRASEQSLNPSAGVLDNASLQELSKISGEVEILRRRVRETNDLKAIELAAAAQRIAQLEDQVRQGESQRRKLHNMVQELRGNIRVFARVRPFLPSDGIDMASLPDSSISTLADGVSVRAVRKPGSGEPSTSLTGEDKGEEHNFSFDRVFGPSTSQETIFNEVSEFVQSALDGYNVCLFSYGQTGSGKTHTMQGSGNGSMRGIIPRAMEQIGKYKNELEGRGWKYEMEVCFVEIYNETIRDLLRLSPSDENKHEIKKDANGSTYISDVTTMKFDPNDLEKIDSIMELSARHRSVSSTLMNDRSSRSHSVFTVYLTAVNESQNANLKGTLSLVDLAGSERLDRSGAQGARMKETVAINKSLSSLVDVFTAIANKQSHIPFRNSKLTYLLQSALSGDGKTLMLVNVSPTEESFYESLCSLRLARQVNQCELGKPKRQCASGSASSSSLSTSSSSSSLASVSAQPNPSQTSKSTPVSRKVATGPSFKAKA